MRKIIKSIYIFLLSCVILTPQTSASAFSKEAELPQMAKEQSPVSSLMKKTKGKGTDINNTNKNKPYYSVPQKWVLIDDTRMLYLYNIPSDMEVTCKSSDTSVLKVSYDDNICKFTGVSAGNAVITITIKEAGSILFAPNKYKFTCKINVSPRAASVKFRQSIYKIKAGKKKQLEVILRPSITKEKPVYETSNTKIATVSPAGVVKAKSAGNCYITAKISNGKKTRCRIIVQPKKKKKVTKNSK